MALNEYELRTMLLPEEKLSFLSRVDSLIQYTKQKIHTVDRYLCRTDVTNFSQTEFINDGDFTIRVRSQDNGEQTLHELTTKTFRTQGERSYFEEHTTLVWSPNDTISIFQDIGFKVFAIIDKNRTQYANGDTTIVLDEITDYGNILEIEVCSNEHNTDLWDWVMRDIITQLWLEKKDFTTDSLSKGLMQKLAEF